MAENYVLSITDMHAFHTIENVAVRLVGFINEDECEAILNVKDAARRISTAESIRSCSVPDVCGKRFVVVVREESTTFGGHTPNIFISSVISHAKYVYSNREFTCSKKKGSVRYKFVPISKGSGD